MRRKLDYKKNTPGLAEMHRQMGSKLVSRKNSAGMVQLRRHSVLELWRIRPGPDGGLLYYPSLWSARSYHIAPWQLADIDQEMYRFYGAMSLPKLIWIVLFTVVGLGSMPFLTVFGTAAATAIVVKGTMAWRLKSMEQSFAGRFGRFERREPCPLFRLAVAGLLGSDVPRGDDAIAVRKITTFRDFLGRIWAWLCTIWVCLRNYVGYPIFAILAFAGFFLHDGPAPLSHFQTKKRLRVGILSKPGLS